MRTYSAAISRETWGYLKAKAQELKQKDSFKDLYRRELKEWTLSGMGLFLDYSKNYLDNEVMELLFKALGEAEIEGRREEMFEGEIFNLTEKRAVLHTLLRDSSDIGGLEKGERMKDLKSEVISVREAFLTFAEDVRLGKLRGVTGKKFKNVVNIGIGGSYLGVKMAYDALANYHNGPKVLFVKNVDGFDLAQTLKQVDLEETLFLVASKTFTTEETMTNAETAKQAIQKKLGKNAVSKHFACMSSHLEAVKEFGIEEENCFRFWDFVGGRYSLWSAIGLPLAISIGKKQFLEMFEGAYECDNHFRTAPPQENFPMVLGLIHFFYATFMNYPTRAVLPYSECLGAFVGHLQQLEMESNGKSIDREGNLIGYSTAPIVWGEAGTNGQHSFYQLLHQGTSHVLVDFIGFCQSGLDEGAEPRWREHDLKLKAHLLAQGEALAFGFSKEEVEKMLAAENISSTQHTLHLANRIFKGGRPSNLLIAEKLTPRTLGKLIALYEHKVFVEGVLWNINSFDQWGVELGKRISKKILPELRSNEGSSRSSFSLSTESAIRMLRNEDN